MVFGLESDFLLVIAWNQVEIGAVFLSFVVLKVRPREKSKWGMVGEIYKIRTRSFIGQRMPWQCQHLAFPQLSFILASFPFFSSQGFWPPLAKMESEFLPSLAGMKSRILVEMETYSKVLQSKDKTNVSQGLGPKLGSWLRLVKARNNAYLLKEYCRHQILISNFNHLKFYFICFDFRSLFYLILFLFWFVSLVLL